MYQSLPVGMLKMAQNPTMSMPSMSMATALSGAVGPRKIRHRHNTAQTNRNRNERARKLDCHSSAEGTGTNNIISASARITKTPEI